MTSSGWSKAKLKLKDRDLEDEFEQFLNESLSDESLSSPHRSITPRGSRSKTKILSNEPKSKFDKPWWATSEDEESSTIAEKLKKTWLKQKSIEKDDIDGVDSPSKNQPENPLAISKDSLDFTASRPGTALDTILSEPEYSSYDDSKKVKEGEEKSESYDRMEHSLSSQVSGEDTTKEDVEGHKSEVTVDTDNTSTYQPGFETLEEIKDKEAFFSELEHNVEDVNYAKLNQQLDGAGSGKSSPDLVHQTSGAEVEGLIPYQPPYYDSSSDNEGERESEHKSSVSNTANEDANESSKAGFEMEENTIQEVVITKPVTKETIKKKGSPLDLLSKVGLMESLDSTGGVNLAERLSKLKEFSPKDSTVSVLDTTTTADMKLTTGQTTADYEEELQRVRGLSAQPSLDMMQPNENVEVLTNTNGNAPVSSGMLILDQSQSSQLQRNQFNLQPVVSNFADEPKVIDAESYLQGNTTTQSVFDESNSYLGQVHRFNNLASATNRLTDDAVKDFELQYTSRTDGFTGTVGEPRGFLLQPVSAVVDESSEESPPTESLKSIKSIAEDRKKKILQKTETLKIRMQSVSEELRNKKNKVTLKKTNIPTRRLPAKSSSTSSNKKTSDQKPPVKTTKQKGKSLKSTTPTKKNDTILSSLNHLNLVASVDSFATYLKDYALQEGNPTIAHREHPNALLASLDREQSLQKELQQLRIAYDGERKRNVKLNELLIRNGKDYEREKQKVCLEYDQCIKDLHEEVFVLKKKLEIKEDESTTANDTRRKQITEITDDDLKKLQHQLVQQESLLTGYQQENERLYNEVRKHQTEKKKFETKMYQENQQLASKIGNLKEQLETQYPVDLDGSASLGAHRITQLINQVKFYQQRETENKQDILSLENEVSSLKRILGVYEKQKNATSSEKGNFKIMWGEDGW